MNAESSRPAPHARPAVLGKGFRPFFLLAAAFALTAIPLWLVALTGHFDPGAYFGATYWHAHEMVFGFTVAVIAGFLLTAVSNWTELPTATGGALGVLAALWLGGRVAVLGAPWLPPVLVAVIDVAFLPALGLACARPILQRTDRRNYAFVGLLSGLSLANLATHLGAAGIWPAGLRLGNLVGVDLVVVAIVIVSGRVIPMFTKNATRVASIHGHPTLERASLALAALGVVLDAAGAPLLFTGGSAGILACTTLARAWHWGFRKALAEPLLWVLHVGHLWLVVGLALRAISALTPAVPFTSALHALTAGSIGMLTLGMMTRVGLGHTGRMLAIPRRMAVAFGIVGGGALLRVVAALVAPHGQHALLMSAGTLWSAGFAIYLVTYAGALLAPRVDRKPG
jgi:uncharacterized protein involved in response to NO